MTVMEQCALPERSVDTLELPDIKEVVTAAANIVAPVWPIKTFIAVNPLQGLEEQPFEEAVLESLHQRHANADGHPGREAVNRELIKWCSIYFDDGQATILMPHREQGLYRAFAELAPYDSRLRGTADARAWLSSLPRSPEDAITQCLEELCIAPEDWEAFIRQGLAALPGWAGHVKWREHWQDSAKAGARPATLVDYVAVRMVLTRLLWPDARLVTEEPATPPPFLKELPIAEQRFRDELLRQLRAQDTTAAPSRPDAQLVFCIDVRSEPFRRAIEAQGNYETLGFAGFFGLPVKVKCHGEAHARASCPVLLKPAHEIHEKPANPGTPEVLRHDRGHLLARLKTSFYQWLKYNFATPFALVEMAGPWFGLRMLARTYAPALLAEVGNASQYILSPSIETEPVLDAIPLAQRADYAEGALRLMGLTKTFAPLVVLCGHGSTTTNNAFASALDCGACGGNHGGSNARILATILNDKGVRTILAERGMVLPVDTLFVAGEHDTTTDLVTLYGDARSSAHGPALDQLRQDLKSARLVNSAHRCKVMGQPTEKAVANTLVRSRDWAQPRPEWGLARNAGFIVGPRALTKAVDLQGRCFLHSYDWTSDPEGRFLTTILTAPVVVAQWINNQYLFSTLDNVAYGAGSKVTKNIVGKIGIVQGNASDLMHGLPLQSVHVSDHERYHEPLRLQTVVYAPRSRVQAIIDAQPVLQKLLFNGWVTLVVLDPEDKNAYLLRRDCRWQEAE